jgi:hypothetical protein
MITLDDARTLLLGVFIGASTTILAINVFKPTTQPVADPLASKRNFAVIDYYRGCDVVKREYKSVFESQYFLHCPK